MTISGKFNNSTTYGIPAEDYARLAKVDLSSYQRQKGKLSYLPWGVSMQVMKTYDPTLDIAVEKEFNGDLYHGNSKLGYYVLVYLTRNGLRASENLTHALRDFRNKAVTESGLNITEVTNSIQRAIAKSIAINTGIGMSLYSQIDESIDFIQEDGNIVTSNAYTTWKSTEDGINWAISKGMTKEEAESLLGSVEPDSRGRKSKSFFYAVEALNSPKTPSKVEKLEKPSFDR